jgi:lysozyme
MDIQALIALLKRHEDDRLQPYDDATGQTLVAGSRLVGNITIAVGVNISAGISEEESALLTNSRIVAVLTDLATFTWWNGLSEPRQIALADLRFNLGPERFREFRHMIHALAIGDFMAAAREMRQSRAAKQAGTRYEELAQMMEQG